MCPFLPWRPLGSFYVLALTNKTAVSFMNKFLSGHILSFLLDIYLGLEVLGHVVCLGLTICGSARWFSTPAVSLYTPTIKV